MQIQEIRLLQKSDLKRRPDIIELKRTIERGSYSNGYHHHRLFFVVIICSLNEAKSS